MRQSTTSIFNKNFHTLIWGILSLGICLLIILIYQIWQLDLVGIELSYKKVVATRYIKYSIAWLSLSTMILGIITLLLSSLRIKIGWLLITLFSLLFLVELLLTQYFLVSKKLLDSVVRHISWAEAREITNNSSSDSNNLLLVGFVISAILLFFIIKKLSKTPINKYILVTFLFGAFSMTILSWDTYKNPFNKKLFFGDIEKSTSNNKIAYLLYSIGYDIKRSKLLNANSNDIPLLTKQLQAKYPTKNFINPNYPFYHEYDSSTAFLNPFFKKDTTLTPNLVFFFMESLSECFIGGNERYGNYMPFLDSLSKKSLYWENFMSITEISYGMLNTTLGGLPDFPFDKVGVVEMENPPKHHNLFNLIDEKDYEMNAFASTNITFDGFQEYLQQNVKDFTPHIYLNDFKDHDGWGCHDGYTFEQAVKWKQNNPSNKPTLDAFFSMSMHFPYYLDPENEASYYQKTDNILSKTDIEDNEYRGAIASVLYTDDQFKWIFEAYQSLPNYENTIFVILGDHRMHNLINSKEHALDQYHIPLIIYSPLLKRANRSQAIANHRDFPLSFYQLLSGNYNFEPLQKGHWLANGLDTSTTFKPSTTQLQGKVFKVYPDDLDYIDEKYLINKDGLYEITPHLKTKQIENDSISQRLWREAYMMQIINNYVLTEDKLLPPED